MQESAGNSDIFRTLCLGFANLGVLVMSYCLGYDSDEARALAGSITSIMTGEAYSHSARIAKEQGPFSGYRDARASGFPKPALPDNTQSMLEVIRLHRAACDQIQESADFKHLKVEAPHVCENASGLGQKHGFRNAQVTVLAPTGTIGFLMYCDTTGIDPVFALL